MPTRKQPTKSLPVKEEHKINLIKNVHIKLNVENLKLGRDERPRNIAVGYLINQLKKL